jgi:hypothetical protein
MVNEGNNSKGCLQIEDGQGRSGRVAIIMGEENPVLRAARNRFGLPSHERRAKVRLLVHSVRRGGCAEETWRII